MAAVSGTNQASGWISGRFQLGQNLVLEDRQDVLRRFVQIVDGADDEAGRRVLAERRAACIGLELGGRAWRAEQQHIVAVDHRRVGDFAIFHPRRAGVECVEAGAARVHVAKAPEPNEIVRPIEIAKRPDHLHSNRFLRFDELPLENFDQRFASAFVERVLAELDDRERTRQPGRTDFIQRARLITLHHSLLLKQSGCPVLKSLVFAWRGIGKRARMNAISNKLHSMPRRKNDPAAMRGRILDAAYALFQQQGYNASSVRNIAEKAGVTGGAFHHHFPTKKDLGLAVIAERVGAAVEETWIEPIRSATAVRERILQILDEIAREVDSHGLVRGCPVNNLTIELALADEAYRGALRSLFDRWREGIAEKLGGADADARATMVIAAYSGAMAIAKVEQRGEPLRVCAREIERLL